MRSKLFRSDYRGSVGPKSRYTTESGTVCSRLHCLSAPAVSATLSASLLATAASQYIFRAVYMRDLNHGRLCSSQKCWCLSGLRLIEYSCCCCSCCCLVGAWRLITQDIRDRLPRRLTDACTSAWSDLHNDVCDTTFHRLSCLHLHLFRSKNNNNTTKWQKNRITRHMACSNSCPL